MTTLRVTAVRDTQVIRLDVEDAEPRPLPYSRSGSTYRPTTLAITYQRADDEPWRLSSWKLTGPRIKKDGTDAQTRADERGYRAETAPDWVTDTITDNAPSVAYSA